MGNLLLFCFTWRFLYYLFIDFNICWLYFNCKELETINNIRGSFHFIVANYLLGIGQFNGTNFDDWQYCEFFETSAYFNNS